jgi:hypothetical protein
MPVPVLMQAPDVFGTLAWFIIFFIFMMLYPRLMLSQLIYQIEQGARKLEALSEKANSMASKKAGNRESKSKIDKFTEFFVIEPSGLDPYGIVKKIDQLVRQTESRFDEFTDEIAPGKSYMEKRQLNYTLRAAIGLRQIAKIVRHFVELSKKFKNLQIAMLVRMQLPILEKIAEGEFRGVEAFLNGWPVGDSIGPMAAASLIDKAKPVAEDIMMGVARIEGRTAYVLKAKGPEPSLGRIDEAIERVSRKHKISRVITIDAAQKLEGEKTGSVAEGVGFAMGGPAQREIIEASLLDKKIPLDSIVVKVGLEEAIVPMRKEIFDSLPEVQSFIRTAARRAPKGSSVLIIGVGNSVGIPDTKKDLDKVRGVVAKVDAKLRAEEKAKKKGRWF